MPRAEWPCVLQWEGDTSAFSGNGFTFGFCQRTTQWLMSITPTSIRNIHGTVLSTTYGNTVFHDYRLEWTPPSTARFDVDNTLVSTNNASLAFAVNRVLFGDGTGAANARAEIASFQFLQGEAVGTAPAVWSGIKALYR